MEKDLQRKALELYFRVKEMYIFAEETTPEFSDFLQPVFEINRGFDHLSRVIAIELGINKNKDPKAYTNENLNKAIGHFYRAFFDVSDWLAMNLRGSVIEEFEGFSHTCIAEVTPEYYSDIKPYLEESSTKIAKIRNKKDVGDSDTIALMENYVRVIDDLREKIVNIRKKKVGLIDCEERRKRENEQNQETNIRISIEVGILLVLIGYLLTKIFSW
jgi:hypothetical protein